ncbi:unnamed protein product [Heterobilharzia americana]|nr:unnamed protein product [Heterobilharzia americana]
MESVINKEVNWFAPRLMEMEESFNRCLEECTGETRLSADQVTKLMNGKYGSHLSWDMICAQSRWAGLLPPLPVEPKPQSDQTNSSTVKRYKSNVNTISHQLHNSRVPYTNDSLKYNYYRKSDSVENQSDLYDFPDCETKLLGVLVLTSKGNEYELIVKQPSLNSKLFSTVGILSGKAKNACPSDVIGLIFEQTNFFASCGGQDSDTGLIYYHSKGLQFQVDETTFLPDSTSNSSTNGWVIHWCQKLNTSPGSMSDIQFDQPFILSIDKERRYNLMCAHTGQHLFTSALESLMQSDSSKLSTFQHFGGVTHPNHFTLKAAVVGPVSDQMQEDLADFIQQLEQRCQQLINKDIPISIWNTDVTKATKMKEIRYFPWEEYGEKVRAVCIGKVEHSFGDNEAADFTSVISAELCGGTHLSKLCDLQDIAVIAVKGRQKTVKEFTCIFGQSAKNAHQYGNALVKEGKLREKQAIENPEEANIHVKWLESVLNDPLSTGLLPLYARLALEAYVYRIKNKTDDNPIDEDRVQLYVQSLETMMRNKCETSHTAIAKLDFDKSDELILAFLRLSTTQPFVVYHENLAVCYFPRLNSNETALNCAHMVAKCLSTELNKVHLTAKGRPIRSTHLNGLERYKYAFLKLLPISEMITNCTNSEISHLHWESYHTLLSDCVNSVLINSES